MNVRELINALLDTGLSTESEVCMYTRRLQKVPFHIFSVEEDSNNTGIIVIKHEFEELQEHEIGYGGISDRLAIRGCDP